ncbi:helix-turn-helix domain-containing protein [Vibrio aerogenes]|uniref:helix-turn-helix domain-containing protein n=1 Tax=Vibrio aerogenes TaxID=92172 RepID=UPI0021C2BB84|nr:hypothetical protein [Vibrio aerogenes]
MDNSPNYVINEEDAENWQVLLNSPCLLPLSDPDFQLPEPEQVKLLRQYLGLSQAKLGRFLGKTVTPKGCSLVRKWETRKSSPEYREIDKNSWRRMLAAAQLCDVLDDLSLVKVPLGK